MLVFLSYINDVLCQVGSLDFMRLGQATSYKRTGTIQNLTRFCQVLTSLDFLVTVYDETTISYKLNQLTSITDIPALFNKLYKL